MGYEQWDNVDDVLKKKEENIKKVRFGISVTLAIGGIILLGSQIIPLIGSFLNGQIYAIKEQNTATPIPDAHKDEIIKDFGYDPGKSYFQNLLANAGLSYDNTYSYNPVTKTMQKVTINTEYLTPMKLTITDVGINSINLHPNVDSYDEAVYNQALKSGLAHFRGTPLPGDGGNSFIYGHSSVSSFFNSYPNDPEIVFSRLENTEIGQKVQIEKDGQTLQYTIRKKKIAEADDFDILNPQGSKETVTLMTCWPLGIGTKRLVVIAERNE